MTKCCSIACFLFLFTFPAQAKILEDVEAPDSTKSLQSTVDSIERVESSTMVQLKRAHRVVWSTTLMAKYIHFLWSASSRYALILVDRHTPESVFEEWYLLDTADVPRLYDLRFDAIEKTIASLPALEGEPGMGIREGLVDSTWLNPHTGKFVYHWGADTSVTVAELVLRTDQAPPTLRIVHIYQAKSRKDVDRILKRLGLKDS